MCDSERHIKVCTRVRERETYKRLHPATPSLSLAHCVNKTQSCCTTLSQNNVGVIHDHAWSCLSLAGRVALNALNLLGHFATCRCHIVADPFYAPSGGYDKNLLLPSTSWGTSPPAGPRYLHACSTRTTSKHHTLVAVCLTIRVLLCATVIRIEAIGGRACYRCPAVVSAHLFTFISATFRSIVHACCTHARATPFTHTRHHAQAAAGGLIS